MKKIGYAFLIVVFVFLAINFYEFKQVIGNDPTKWRTQVIEPMRLEVGIPYQLGIWNSWVTNLLTFEYKTSTRSKFCFTSTRKGEDSGSCYEGRFNIAAPSPSFMAPRGLEFTDTTGYGVEDGKYFLIYPTMVELPAQNAEEITNPYGVKILKIRGMTGTDENGQTTFFGTPGEGFIGAVINSSDTNYPGITIKMTLAEDLSEELFDRILSTVRWVE